MTPTPIELHRNPARDRRDCPAGPAEFAVRHRSRPILGALLAILAFAATMRGEDGYELWLRYRPVADANLRAHYAGAAREVVFATPEGVESATIAAARREAATALTGLLGAAPPIRLERTAGAVEGAGDDGFRLQSNRRDGRAGILISANSDVGVLYGAFALLRRIQTQQPIDRLDAVSRPRISRRLLNHWDNLDRSVERGYAGQSLWEWFHLPEYITPRYRDYARACASVGINGAVLNNVNSDAAILTPEYLEKAAALAGALRPYGIRIYLTARFSAPMEIGGMTTADPLDPEVAAWWRRKADEIYGLVPDFGGFLVKANSEGQPGPGDYNRSHAEGANLLADALAPHGGIVIWRAFVYDAKLAEDRFKQAFNEFTPLDGKFRPNVVIQVKSGPIDFMPREPFHPLFGAMPRTPLAIELQITQEYFSHGVHLAFLAPQYKETLDSDTFAAGPGSTVARVLDGSLWGHEPSVIAGVANTGTDRNWCGHPIASANWYAFGRLAWDHALDARAIADEWTRMTFSNDDRVVKPMIEILLASREAGVDYRMPLGLHHIMELYHHYGPEPWLDKGRPDWTPVYYHRAGADGLGFDRTASGSNALSLYAPEAAKRWADPATCPLEYLLWFHHLPWDYRLRTGRTLWDELCLRYQRGVDAVREWQKIWAGLANLIDEERHTHVASLLKRQERDARWWRDACLLYFQTFSRRPLPEGVEPPEHSLDYYKSIRLRNVPGTPWELYRANLGESESK